MPFNELLCRNVRLGVSSLFLWVFLRVSAPPPIPVCLPHSNARQQCHWEGGGVFASLSAVWAVLEPRCKGLWVVFFTEFTVTLVFYVRAGWQGSGWGWRLWSMCHTGRLWLIWFTLSVFKPLEKFYNFAFLKPQMFLFVIEKSSVLQQFCQNDYYKNRNMKNIIFCSVNTFWPILRIGSCRTMCYKVDFVYKISSREKMTFIRLLFGEFDSNSGCDCHQRSYSNVFLIFGKLYWQNEGLTTVRPFTAMVSKTVDGPAAFCVPVRSTQDWTIFLGTIREVSEIITIFKAANATQLCVRARSHPLISHRVGLCQLRIHFCICCWKLPIWRAARAVFAFLLLCCRRTLLIGTLQWR